MFRYSPPFCGVVNKILSAYQDERKTTLELAYPSICQQIITVKNYNACEEIYRPKKVTEWTNEQKENFAKTVLRYTQENIVMVNIFMKDPFAQKILIQANAGRYAYNNISTFNTFLIECFTHSFSKHIHLYFMGKVNKIDYFGRIFSVY